MALETETVLRPLFLAAGGDGDGDGEVSGREAAPLMFLTMEKDRPAVDAMIWRDEKRMKRELLVWAKTVASMASMAASNNSTSSSSSSSPSQSPRWRG